MWIITLDIITLDIITLDIITLDIITLDIITLDIITLDIITLDIITLDIITLDVKDLYVNLPIQGIIRTTKFWLNKNINDNELIKQELYMLKTIMKQNYFQYNERLFQPGKGIAVGSPISSIMAEVCLQYIEETYVKQC